MSCAKLQQQSFPCNFGSVKPPSGTHWPSSTSPIVFISVCPSLCRTMQGLYQMQHQMNFGFHSPKWSFWHVIQSRQQNGQTCGKIIHSHLRVIHQQIIHLIQQAHNMQDSRFQFVAGIQKCFWSRNKKWHQVATFCCPSCELWWSRTLFANHSFSQGVQLVLNFVFFVILAQLLVQIADASLHICKLW